MRIYDKITPETVGRYLGISARAVREAMENGTLKIGHVNITEGGQKQYVILPKQLYEATGVKLNGYEPPPKVNIDYEVLAKEVVKEFMSAISSSLEQE